MLPEHQLCSGCGACAASCPQNCIKMVCDREGFRYPVVDRAACCSCGICEQRCPALTPVSTQEGTVAVAAQNRDADIRRKSSSGGVFSALGQYALAQGGIACAAIYDGCKVRHTIIDRPEDLAAMRGAKYAQSETEHCFPRIREELRAGRTVLFVGTPCQTAGLRRYLDTDYASLILVDMVCHGVPSPRVWQEYLRERQQADAPGSSIQSIDLRSKETGWSRYAYCVKIRYQDGTEYQCPQGQDWFMRGFVQNLYLRPSCAQCAFKGMERCSDLTLGDCWGIWDIAPEYDDDLGTSLLLIHGEKGQAIWNAVSPQFHVRALSLEQAVAQNPSAVSSAIPHSERERFFREENGGTQVIERIRKCLEPERASVWKNIKKRFGFPL